jgi:hypothetical protein
MNWPPILVAALIVSCVSQFVLWRWVRRKVRQLDTLTGVALDCRDHCRGYLASCRAEADAAQRYATAARRCAAEAHAAVDTNPGSKSAG